MFRHAFRHHISSFADAADRHADFRRFHHAIARCRRRHFAPSFIFSSHMPLPILIFIFAIHFPFLRLMPGAAFRHAFHHCFAAISFVAIMLLPFFASRHAFFRFRFIKRISLSFATFHCFHFSLSLAEFFRHFSPLPRCLHSIYRPILMPFSLLRFDYAAGCRGYATPPFRPCPLFIAFSCLPPALSFAAAAIFFFFFRCRFRRFF